MYVNLQRLQHYEDYTIGAIYVDGVLIGWTLEDESRADKVMHETRIPQGTYTIGLQTTGRLHTKYSQLFDFHKGMLLVRDVPNFKGIMIHIGNTDDDTSGCILVGFSHTIGKNLIANSRDCYATLYKLIVKAIERKERVLLVVTDEFLR